MRSLGDWTGPSEEGREGPGHTSVVFHPNAKPDSNLRKHRGPREGEGGLRDHGRHLHAVQLKSGRSD